MSGTTPTPATPDELPMKESYKLILRPFRFSGRLTRSGFWLVTLATLASFTVLFVFLETSIGRSATWVLYPPLLWLSAAALIRRLHDRDLSALWLVLLVIPVVGVAWIAFTACLRGGTPGENRYGDDPRLKDADYLTVQ
jgi:uncharacterized membrane protein YhaH (DUF805 family)